MFSPLILQKEDGFYSIPLFERYGFRAIFSTRKYDMAFGAADRRAAFKASGISGRRLVTPSQIHADRVVLVREAQAGRGAYGRGNAIPGTDALITRAHFLPLGVLTADCLPLFIADTEKRAIAVVHAGWKSLRLRIVAKVLQRIFGRFGSAPGDIIAAIGPCIRPCCYKVGHAFIRRFPGHARVRDAGVYLDLVSAAAAQLVQMGIPAGHVADSRICTSCMHEEFFSYRREGASAGRSMSVLEIR